MQCPVRLKRCPESELFLEEGDLEMICELSLERGSWNRVVMGVSVLEVSIIEVMYSGSEMSSMSIVMVVKGSQIELSY